MIILGWLLVALVILAEIGGGPKPPTDKETVYVVAFYVGYYMPLALSIILLLVGYRLRRRAKHKKKEADLLGDFLTDKPEKQKDI